MTWRRNKNFKRCSLTTQRCGIDAIAVGLSVCWKGCYCKYRVIRHESDVLSDIDNIIASGKQLY